MLILKCILTLFFFQPYMLIMLVFYSCFMQITVDTDRTVVAFYKFLKKHATNPFKLQKPALSTQPKGSDATTSDDGSSKDLKDEL